MTKQEKRPAKTPASRAKGWLNVAAKSSGATSTPQFPVVGIGASAGGLEACTALLKALPVNPGMAFVVVQHLDPHHESILHKLLSKTTEMPVIQVEDGMVLEPDHVYVIPPNKDIAVRERTLRLLSRRRTAGRHLPINRFFVSLAEDQRSAAIGVILSGTASDGTAGLQAIKSEGGVAFAQDPKSAGYPGMPESAILAGCVDFILRPEEIARELIRLGQLPYAKRTAAVLQAEPPLVGATELQKIIHILRIAGSRLQAPQDRIEKRWWSGGTGFERTECAYECPRQKNSGPLARWNRSTEAGEISIAAANRCRARRVRTSRSKFAIRPHQRSAEGH